MASVFTNNPISGDVWDMQGAIIHFTVLNGKGGTTSISGGSTTSSTSGNTTTPAGPTSNIGTGGAPVIALGLSLSFSRGLTKRFPINVRRVIYLMGNPEGSLTLNCLFGPSNSMLTFIQGFSALGANAATTNNAGGTHTGTTSITIIPFGQITYSGGQGSQVGNVGLGTWLINDPVITGIGLTIQEGGAQGATSAVAQVTMTFNNLDIS